MSETTTLDAGARAPEFTLEADDGSTVRLKDLRGRTVVLYFYPKDDTPGCTVEACEFRDALPRFEKIGALVYGVSPDDVTSHQKFKKKFGLTFPLLADPDHDTAEKYGVWKEKNMYGRKMMGVERSTFIIDKDGLIARVFRRVKAEGHADQIRAAIADLR
jgi:peroxiredoxin Q/BCP